MANPCDTGICCPERCRDRDCSEEILQFHKKEKEQNEMDHKLKALGKGELVRRLKESIALVELSQRELQKWIGGFVDVAAKLYIINNTDPVFKQLPESTMEQVKSKVKELSDE